MTNNLKSSQKITEIDFADFCEDNSTIAVTVESNKDKETFYVQTVDGEFRSDLGCWVIAENSSGEDVDEDDYPNFDIADIVREAECFIQDEIKYEFTEYEIAGETAWLVISPLNVKVVTENRNFINKHSSSYEREFSEAIETFDNKEEAIEYLEKVD